MWKKGGYDHENGYEIDDDGEYADGLSDEDTDVISNLISTYKKLSPSADLKFDSVSSAPESNRSAKQ